MKLAIISGGSRGLGLALGELYQARQWRVVEFSRSAPHPWSIAADLAQPESARQVFAAEFAALARQSWDEVVVIANAGVLAPIGPTSRKDPADVLANMHVNFVSPVMLMTQAIAAFQDATCPKALLNISSGAALNGTAGWSLYCAAKAGLENFIRAVAAEQSVQAWPLRAVNISPGVIDTEMQAAIRAASADDFPAVGRFIQRKADGELRSPARVAAAVARIADDARVAGGSRVDVADYLDGPA